MGTNMQKWHNWEIHGDVLWCGWCFWRRAFDNPRDRETNWKITCRKNLRVSGRLFSFRSLCCNSNRTWNWFPENEGETVWLTVDLFNAYGPSSSSSSSSSFTPSPLLCIITITLSLSLWTHNLFSLAKVWNRNIPAWQISAYQLSELGELLTIWLIYSNDSLVRACVLPGWEVAMFQQNVSLIGLSYFCR